jgi:hypothetical protein
MRTFAAVHGLKRAGPPASKQIQPERGNRFRSCSPDIVGRLGPRALYERALAYDPVNADALVQHGRPGRFAPTPLC